MSKSRFVTDDTSVVFDPDPDMPVGYHEKGKDVSKKEEARRDKQATSGEDDALPPVGS